VLGVVRRAEGPNGLIRDPVHAMHLPFMPRRVTDVLAIVALAAVYVLVARFGLAFDAVAGFATLVWPPTGISLAAVLLLGYRVCPGIFIGAAIANALIGASPAVALGIATGNTLEALAGAYLLRRFVPQFRTALESVTSVFGLIVFAALLSPVLSASFGVASLYLGDFITRSNLAETWRAWWLGDMVGALLAAPIILVWATRPRARFRQNWVELLALGIAVIAASVTTFFSGRTGVPTLRTPFHQMELLFAGLICAALLFGQRGAATAAFVISATALAGTTRGYGPFAHAELYQSLLSLQTFMALIAAIVLLLGATVAERRIAHEQTKKARNAARRANLEKFEFLAVMSHELRTPLNAIAGYSELLETGVYGPLSKKQTDVVGRIHESERRLLTVIDEVLGFARAEKGQVSVKTGRIQVADVFDAVEPLIGPELRSKHFVLTRDLPRSSLAVLADPVSLQQILMCLLSNASKYTEEGGTITLGAKQRGKKVYIRVSDTGAGIPEDQIENVFEPFFQTNHGTTRKSTGVGLGLTIARDLARRMKGDLTIASKVGSGTTASVVLPAA
jgi:signal transduction histidine kinase